MQWAMGDVADQTRLGLTKVALGSCLGFCIRGGGNPFISLKFAVIPILGLGGCES